MLRYLFVCFALFSSWPVLAADDEREFAQQMLERLQAAMPDSELRVVADDPLAIQMKMDGNWEGGVINIHRIYGFCRVASREDCEAAAEEFATNLSLAPPAAAAGDLRVIVRDQAYLDYLLQAGPGHDQQPLYRQIGEDLFAIVAFDSPKTISLALRWQLRELGIDDEAAWQLAMAQTKAVLPALPSGADLARHAVAFQEYEYLPGLLADTDSWSAIARDAGPNMFATAVADSFVFVGSMPDGPDLDRFKQTVLEDCQSQQRCISPNIYRFRDGRWMIAR